MTLPRMHRPTSFRLSRRRPARRRGRRANAVPPLEHVARSVSSSRGSSVPPQPLDVWPRRRARQLQRRLHVGQPAVQHARRGRPGRRPGAASISSTGTAFSTGVQPRAAATRDAARLEDAQRLVPRSRGARRPAPRRQLRVGSAQEDLVEQRVQSRRPLRGARAPPRPPRPCRRPAPGSGPGARCRHCSSAIGAILSMRSTARIPAATLSNSSRARAGCMRHSDDPEVIDQDAAPLAREARAARSAPRRSGWRW